MNEMASACRANGMTDLIMVHEHRGIPDAMVVSHFPHGPTVLFSLHNVVLRHDVPSGSTSTVSEQYPHLIFDGFSSKLGQRIMSVLKYLFPVPRDESTRVMTFQNQRDFISFRCVTSLSSSFLFLSKQEMLMITFLDIMFLSRPHTKKCNWQRLGQGLIYEVNLISLKVKLL